jgi:drug/metabolite transporter (DMT)-like permease
VLFGRVRRFFNERPDIGIIVSAVVGIALVAFVVVLDASLIVRAYQRSEAAAVVVGVGAALGTVLGVVWYLRRVSHLGATTRRVLGWVGIAWAGLFVVGFWWTHPVHRDDHDELGTPLAVAVLGYVLVIVVAAVGFVPVAVLRLARTATHHPDDRVEVWHIRDDKPYFVAHCDCDWVGTAHDATEPHARDKAFREAREHGTEVAPEVGYPLG